MSTELATKEAAPVSSVQTQPMVRPAVNIRQTGDGYTLEVEMPGVSKGGVEITFEDGKLALVGRRNRTPSSAQPVYRESPDADYRRVFDLDPTVDAEKIKASIEQGLLKVHLPKAESAKPRRIQVA